MNDNHARLSPALVETIAGLSAGGASTLAVHPLDVIKTRLQSTSRRTPHSLCPSRTPIFLDHLFKSSQYHVQAPPLTSRPVHRTHTTLTTSTNSLTILRSLLSQPRPLATLYRGLTPNLFGNSTSWALFFYFKSLLETPLAAHRSRHSSHLHPSDYFLTSLSAGLLTTLATNPIWVLKTRMLSTDRGARGAYTSMWAGIQHIRHREGWRGFYRGLGVSCLGVSHGAVQFAVYQPLKDAWLTYVARSSSAPAPAPEPGGAGGETKLGNEATLVISGAAKIVAGAVTYPYQVLRARLQTHDAEERFGRGIRGVAGKVWAEEGWRGFYKGLGPNVMRVLPATWVTFLVYENMRFYLPRAEW